MFPLPQDHEFCNEFCQCGACREDRLTLHVKVSKGAAFLDSKVSDWHEHINFEQFVKNDDLAVQVLGSPEVSLKYEALSMLGLNTQDETREHGFSSTYGHTDLMLKDAWVGLILRRHVEDV